MSHHGSVLDTFGVLRPFRARSGSLVHNEEQLLSLPALEEAEGWAISRLPISIRIILESALRHCNATPAGRQQVRKLASWTANGPRIDEVPFVVARVLLQDFAGVALLVDFATMRNFATEAGKDPRAIEPRVPVDLVIDHSIVNDYVRHSNALDLNMQLEFTRNAERYRFIKWAAQAFDLLNVIPPGTGIVHQVNLEHLARGVICRDGVYSPDSLVGTDSHTTMINGIGLVGWGVGGIEAEASMLGQPVYFLTPDVVGVELVGEVAEGVTATDLVLSLTERLRGERVVGAFVEFFGEAISSLDVPTRATIANMAPEYGATMALFPVDDATVGYYRATGRGEAHVATIEAYFRAQGLYGTPRRGEIDYTRTVTVDLRQIRACVAGPKRPQDRIDLSRVREAFLDLQSKSVVRGGVAQPGRSGTECIRTSQGTELSSGDVLIAAITSCTNTSNPRVMVSAGLLAKKAIERGLSVPAHIRTSLSPGSRVVSAYLESAGLLRFLEELGFAVTAYGCATCVGNAGEFASDIDEAILRNNLVCAAVISGNRNFEARIHRNIRATFLASPPLVVAYALAGTVLKDLTTEPIARTADGDVYLRDLWPSSREIVDALQGATTPAHYQRVYSDLASGDRRWEAIAVQTGSTYAWPDSTYLARSPFLDGASAATADIRGARALAILGDSITTDHISPVGAIEASSPAGEYLRSCHVAPQDFNSYGARRGNHEVMVRGTFCNPRLNNLMLAPREDGTRVEGGVTCHQPTGEIVSIYDAAMRYRAQGIPTLIFAGEEYGMGSARDWAAKGPLLLGVRAVIARSFERIHRSNLVGMGILPCQLEWSDSLDALGLVGTETFDLRGLEAGLEPRMVLTLEVKYADGRTRQERLRLRVETPIEVAYLERGGILPFLLEKLLHSVPDLLPLPPGASVQ